LLIGSRLSGKASGTARFMSCIQNMTGVRPADKPAGAFRQSGRARSGFGSGFKDARSIWARKCNGFPSTRSAS
jgi:hypothetical protein